ncbi:hypothetical protein SADUNF_Sadunf05G0168100 [Salix dunnii]|uniref:LysM domain-containing protein n=1 Tax=Salix dunnii TaxID=1413687 RepID=A0A835K6P4_9ROSI|nr:hypothetical protein SADUNF_Sadunf05G0168100 [Salix dunnii]
MATSSTKTFLLFNLASMLLIASAVESRSVLGRAAASIPECDSVHGVETGDTCSAVEKQFDLTAKDFNAINPNLDCDKLFTNRESKEKWWVQIVRKTLARSTATYPGEVANRSTHHDSASMQNKPALHATQPHQSPPLPPYKVSFKCQHKSPLLSFFFFLLLSYTPSMTKLVVLSLLSLFAYAAVASTEMQRRDAQQCQLRRISASKPSHRMRSQGGVTEIWDTEEDQFQCAGFAPMRDTIQINSLSLPKFFPAPRLVYWSNGSQLSWMPRDISQRLTIFKRPRPERNVRRPAPESSQDSPRRCHCRASCGQSRHGQERYERSSRRYAGQSEWSHEETFQNIFHGFDEELLAEAFNVPRETQEQFESSPRNGLEDTFCTMKIKHNIELQRQADVYTKQGRRINIANQKKLPILQFPDMSAERGHLMPNALYTPHWFMTDNRVVYALRGELNAQIVDERGNTIMNERVREGGMFVIPQFYATLMRAGNNGFEWVSFKSSSQPMKNPLAGSISVMRAIPIDVISSAYQISPREAGQLKTNRDPQSMLLSPTRTSS